MNPRNCLMLVGMLAACGGVVDDAKDKVDEGANNTKEMINDTAVCKGLIRDSVSARIESVITDQIGGDSPIALSDLTQIAKAYALTLDSTSLLAGNVIAIAAATETSQCGQTLDCNDPVLSESVGTLTKTCDSDVETYAFEEGCQLYATPISGAVSIDGPLWTFDQFQVVDDRYLDGGVFLENVSADRFAVDSIDADGFELARNRGKSCEDLLRFRTLDVTRDANYTVTTDFDRETDAGTDYTVKTDALAWPADRSCSCPIGGTASLLMSAFQEKRVPLTLQFAFQSEGDCGSPAVTVPEVESFCGDYGCDATQLTDGLTTLFRGFCEL